MSAETLRRAATEMRAKAEAAESSFKQRDPNSDHMVAILHVQDAIAGHPSFGDHIAGMSPAVALAVADWLGRCAADHDETPCPALDAALTVARAYLNESL